MKIGTKYRIIHSMFVIILLYFRRNKLISCKYINILYEILTNFYYSLIMRILSGWSLYPILISLLMIGGGTARASFFGFQPMPCDSSDNFDEAKHLCYYCPRGSVQRELECLGVPYLGTRCPHGADHFYEPQTQRCVYCQEGYVYLFIDGKCHKKK